MDNTTTSQTTTSTDTPTFSVGNPAVKSTSGVHNPEVKKVAKAVIVGVLTVVVNFIFNTFHVNPALLGGTASVVYYVATQVEHLIPTYA